MTPAAARVDTEGPLPEELAPFIASPQRSALFLDFDGTLAAIVADPRDARPLPGVPQLLTDLAATFELVAVISGRPTSFLAEALGPPPGVTLAGLYGLERALRGPEHDAWAHIIDEVVAEAQATAPEGVYVEPKGLTVTLHFRKARDQKDWVVAFAERAAATHDLLIHPGRHERELRPPLEVDKGTVVRSLVGEIADRLDNAAAFGDDIGDLPAFAALDELATADADADADADAQRLYTVRVAAVDTESPAQVAQAADLTVSGATGAVALLRRLADAVNATSSASGGGSAKPQS